MQVAEIAKIQRQIARVAPVHLLSNRINAATHHVLPAVDPTRINV